MILGMSTATFTNFHVLLSLVGIGVGLVVLLAMIGNKRLPAWAAIFLTTTVATSVTGFLFPIHGLTPGHVVGILSLVVLALAIAGLYRFQLAGGWRKTYLICSTIALYVNVFVLVVQSFQKVPALHDLAPTQSEPPFAVTQLVVLAAFIALGIVAARKFHDEPLRAVGAAGGR
jgi:hypothetical protein